jgi:hypothetical protein
MGGNQTGIHGLESVDVSKKIKINKNQYKKRERSRGSE